jgi:hypothetical protein
MREAEASSKPIDRLGPLQKSITEERFTLMAETLDAAGLGPADYLYLPLKWRLQKPDVKQSSFGPALWRSVKEALVNPLPVPRGLRPAPIVIATSYLVSAKLLRQVAATLEPAERVFYYLGDIAPQPLPSRLADYVRAVVAFGPALMFAKRVRSILRKAGIEVVERDRAALAAFTHRMHRQTARSILDRVRPKCLVIGNGNRPLELSLWAEAKARRVATVLVPYTEITLKPSRFLSLCRGDFDLVLPFSESSAVQIRRLKPNVATVVVGFPVGFNARQDIAEDEQDIAEDENESVAGAKRLQALYFAGTNFEAGAAGLLGEAFHGSSGLRLRVRLHPRSGNEGREIFDWLEPDDISDPHLVALSDDIKNSGVVLAVRSTAAIEAMIAGVPCIWLSPESAREQLKFSTLRAQNLTPLEASTPGELHAILRRLRDIEGERQRIVNHQWARLRAVGYDRNYFELVTTALRQMVGGVRT